MNEVPLFFLTLDYGEYVISLLVSIKTKVNSVYGIHPPLLWNNFNRLSIRFSYLKNKFGHDIEDCIEPICNSFQKGGARQDLNFERGLLEKRG